MGKTTDPRARVKRFVDAVEEALADYDRTGEIDEEELMAARDAAVELEAHFDDKRTRTGVSLSKREQLDLWEAVSNLSQVLLEVVRGG